MRTLVFLVLSFIATFASAECYIGGSLGQSNVTRVPAHKNEQLIRSDHVDGTYVVDRTGKMHDVFFGCSLPSDFAVELGYMRGTVARIDTRGNFVAPSFTDRTIPFSVAESVTATVSTLSVLKYVDMSESFSLFGRLGVAHTRAAINASVPLGDGYSLRYTDQRKLNSPYLGAGIAWRGERLTVRLEEHVFAKQIFETRLSAMYAF